MDELLAQERECIEVKAKELAELHERLAKLKEINGEVQRRRAASAHKRREARVDALLAELQAATELDTSMGKEGELMVHQSAEDGTVRRWPFPYHFGPAFTALIDNPRNTPLMHGRLGADVKLDHEYVQTLRPHPAGSGIAVARGGIPGGPANHATKITGSGRGELMTVVYELLDVAPEDGGFGAVTVRTTPHLPRCFCARVCI